MSALDMAKENNFPEVCELLQKHGAKPGGPGSQVHSVWSTPHFSTIINVYALGDVIVYLMHLLSS